MHGAADELSNGKRFCRAGASSSCSEAAKAGRGGIWALTCSLVSCYHLKDIGVDLGDEFRRSYWFKGLCLDHSMSQSQFRQFTSLTIVRKERELGLA